MRILAVIDSFGLGGAETQLAETLGWLARCRGHECVACSLRPPRAVEARFDPSVEQHWLHKTSRWSLGAVLRSLRDLIRARRPSVIYSRLPMGNALARLATTLSGIGVRHVAGIDTVPDMYPLTYSLAHPGSVLFRCVERLADCLVCNSDATCRAMAAAGYPARKLRVVPNGIDVDRFTPPQARGGRTIPRAVCVASLRPEKGMPRLVRTLAPLLAARRLDLVLVGDGEERSNVERAVRDAGVEGAVTLAGAQPDVVPFLQAADLYVQAAHVEGFGISVAEAAACGLPAVAFSAPGGMAEVVLEGRTGWFVDSNDAAGFREAVERLIGDESLRSRMGAAAREHVVRHYALPIVGHQLEDVLGER